MSSNLGWSFGGEDEEGKAPLRLAEREAPYRLSLRMGCSTRRGRPPAHGVRVSRPGGAGLGRVVDVSASRRAHVDRDRHRQRGRGHPRDPSGKQTVHRVIL